MRVLTLAILFGAALAGCSDPSETADAPVEQAPETGSIGGIILDAAVVPLQGVQVHLDGAQTTSAADGTWRIEDLEPGTAIVTATRDDLLPVQVQTQVLPGTHVDVAITMRYNITADPFVVSSQWKGFIDCSLRIGTAGTSGSIGLNACNELGTQGVGQQSVNRVHTFDEGTPDWFQTEIEWTQTTTGGSDLALMVGPEACIDPKYHWVSGPSPLWYRLDAFETAARDLGPETALCSRVFAATSGELGHVAGIQFQQGFDGFSHAFYNSTPGEGWLFVRDGPPSPQG